MGAILSIGVWRGGSMMARLALVRELSNLGRWKMDLLRSSETRFGNAYA
jgi:hypothetical protein